MVKRAEQLGRCALESGGNNGGGGSGDSLPEAAEELLQKIFAVQSELPDALAESVAARTGCTPAAALAFFMQLHTSFKRCLHRLADSGADARDPLGPPDKEAALAAAAAGAAAREAARAKLRPLLDGGSGGLRDMSVTGRFAFLMAGLSSNVVRVQAAQAVAASKRTVRAKLVATPGFLATLERWLGEAQQQEFYTLQRQVLTALDALPLGTARKNDQLTAAVGRLQGSAHAGVAAAAEELAAKWEEALAADGAAEPLPAALEAAAAALPSRAAARVPGSEPRAAGGYQALPSAGIPSGTERRPSANGVNKQPERQDEAEATSAPAQQPQVQKPAGQQAQHAQRGQYAQQGQQAQQAQQPRQDVCQEQQPLPSHHQQQQQQKQPLPSQQRLQQSSGAATAASQRSLQSSPLLQKIKRNLAAAKSAAGPAPSSASGAGGTSVLAPPAGAEVGSRAQADKPHAPAAAVAVVLPAPSVTQASAAGLEPARGQQQPQAAGGGGEQEAASAEPTPAPSLKELAPAPPPQPVASAAQQPPASQPNAQAGGQAALSATPSAVQPASCQAAPRPAAPAKAPTGTLPRTPRDAEAPGRATAARSPPAAPAAAAAPQQPHQQQHHRPEARPNPKRRREAEPGWQTDPAGARVPHGLPAAAGRGAAKRMRQSAGTMREQVAWRPPPACADALDGPAAHGRPAAAPARGEDSSEAPAMAALRRAGRLPACDDGGPVQDRVPAMPWWPLAPSEVREQRARLEAAGWRGWAD